MTTFKKNTEIKRGAAIRAFVGAYLVVTVLCAALSIAIIAIQHDPSNSSQAVHGRGYVDSERFDPFINLAVWTYFARRYFRRLPDAARSLRHGLLLGRMWLGIALPVDLIFFVIIKNPISLSPHDFYVGQFPWIYLIYCTVFLGPVCAAALASRRSSRRAAVAG